MYCRYSHSSIIENFQKSNFSKCVPEFFSPIILPLRLAPLYSYNLKYPTVRFYSVRKASFDLNKELSRKGLIFKHIILNMVRTKGDRVPTKAMGAKAPHKFASTKKAGSSKARSYSGGNPYHPRDTPEWQKPITNFMNQNVTKQPDSASSKNNENEENNTDNTSVDTDTDTDEN